MGAVTYLNPCTFGVRQVLRRVFPLCGVATIPDMLTQRYSVDRRSFVTCFTRILTKTGQIFYVSNQRDFPEGREVAPLAADEFTVRVGGLRLPEAPLELSAANLFLLSRASIVPVGLTIFREREVEPATAGVKGSTTGCAGTLRRWVKHNTLASKYTYLWSVHTGQEGYADPSH